MRGERRTFWLCGILLCAGIGAEAVLSRSFVYGEGHEARPLPLFMATHLGVSALYACAVWLASRQTSPPSRRSAAALWAMALAPRIFFMDSNPIQEDDFYRYLWDGNVVLAGVNPYNHAPAELADLSGENASPAQQRLLALRDGSPEARRTFDRINHPQYSTVYPPALVGVFALSQVVAPWNLLGLRCAWLVFDAGILIFLWRLLPHLGVPRRLWVAYAWCPLVIKETVNAVHADVVPTFFVIACLYAAATARPLWASAALGAAVLSKLFPLALLPLWGAWLLRGGFRRLATGGAVFVATVAVIGSAAGWPTLTAHSGFLAYAREWWANSALFAALETGWGDRAARGVAAFGVLAASLWQAFRLRPCDGVASLAWGFFVVTAAIFCLSPAQFPWYFVWVVPFLCLFPSAPWTLLSGLLTLYYANFWILYNVGSLHEGPGGRLWRTVLVIEHLPFLLFMAYRMIRLRTGSGRRARALAASPILPTAREVSP